MAKKDTQPTAENSQPSMLAPDTTFEITLPWDEVKPVYEKNLRRLATRVKMDGFRKGKVPPQLAKQAVGEEQAVEATLEQLVPAKYVAELKNRELQPIGQPEFHPETVNPGTDWKLHVHIAEKPTIKLGDWKKTTKKAKEDFLKEKAKKETESKETDQKTEQAKDQEKANQEMIGMLYGALVTSIRPQIPELLVKQEATAQLRQLGQQLEQFKLTFEDFLQRQGMTQDQLTQQVTGESLGRLQLAFIIDAIITEEKLQPSDVDVEAELKDKSKDIQEYYAQHEDAVATLKNRLAQQKAERLLLDL